MVEGGRAGRGREMRKNGKWEKKKAVKKKGNIHIYIYIENALQKGEKWKKQCKKGEK